MNCIRPCEFEALINNVLRQNILIQHSIYEALIFGVQSIKFHNVCSLLGIRSRKAFLAIPTNLRLVVYVVL